MRRAATAALVLATVLATGAPASAAAPDTTAAAPRVGVYVFIASQGEVETALATGELRRLVENHLREGLAGRGAVVLGAAALRPAVARHRVRTSLLADRAFLDELVAAPGLDRLQLVDLIILPSNLLLAVREVELPSGMLAAVRLAEVNLQETEFPPDVTADADRWRFCLARLCADTATLPGTPLAGQARGTLAVLPCESHGGDDVAALATGVLLLRHVLNDGTFVVPDPALVATTLQAAGLSPHRLDDAGRALLRERFPGHRILHPAIYSYESKSRSGSLDVPDLGPVAPDGVLLASGTLSLWLVDLTRGELVGVAEHYFEMRRETGWFGIPDTRSPVLQLDAALLDLWRDFAATQEGF